MFPAILTFFPYSRSILHGKGKTKNRCARVHCCPPLTLGLDKPVLHPAHVRILLVFQVLPKNKADRWLKSVQISMNVEQIINKALVF